MAWDLCRHVQIMWRTSLRMLLSSPQTPEFASCLFLFLFSLFGYTRARDLSLTVSSITSRLPGCHGCVQRRKPLDFRLEHRGSFSNPLSSFLTNTFLARSCLSASLWFFPSLAVPPRLSPVSPWRRGVTPGASSQEPVRRVVQTTGKISSTSSE